MIAIAYFLTAAALLALAHRYVAPLTRGAALALILLPLVFTGRALLTGRVYAPIELPYITQPLADHRAELNVPAPVNGVLSDIAFQMIPWRQAMREQLAAGEWPLWNRFIQCGDILAATMQPGAYSPFTWIACLFPAALSFTFTGAITFFVAGLGAYVLVAEYRGLEVSALFAAAAWSLSAGLALTVLWPLGFAWALFPFVLLGARRAARNGEIGVLAVAFVLEIVAGHPETLLHVVAIAALYGAFELWRSERKGRGVGAAVGGGVLALLITAIALLPFLEAARNAGEYVVRAKMFATAPLPLKPGAVRAAFLGNLFPFLRGPVESFPLERAEGGSILFALGIAVAISVRRREVWFFAALATVALLAGSNVWPVAQILHALPLFDSAFNDRLAIAMPLALAVLAAFAIDAWPRRTIAAVMLAWAVAVAVAGGTDGGTIHRGRFAAELVPLAIAAIVVWLVRKPVAVPILLGLLLAQRTMSDGRLVPTHPRELAYPRLKLFDPMTEVREPFRVAPFAGTMIPNTPAMYGFEDVRGSTAMTFAPFGETYPLWLERPNGGFPQVTDLTKPILSMMNVRFSLLDVSTPIPPGWRDRGYDVYTRLIENERVLPRAFVPATVVFGRTPAEELAEMAKEPDFAQRAWLDAPDAPHELSNGPGRVTTTTGMNGLDLVAVMEQPGFVVISEAAWPGWRGWVDGRRVNAIGANHAFLAVYVPAGEHRVRLRYLPQSFVVGRAISGATLLLVALVTFARRFWP